MPDLDLLILGSGVAGLSAAVRAAAGPGMRVGVLTKAELEQTATRWAQGGVAAVLSTDEDSADLHLADTLAAGAGLCDTDAVRVLVEQGPTRVQDLIALGAVFDTDTEGNLLRAREGGHSIPRIVHAGGAATGWEIERALVVAVNETAAAVLERWFVLDFVVEGGRCRGVVALDEHGERREVRATHVLVATGGAGQLFSVTTNPVQATGDASAMGLRAGVAVADVEFMQFHPTALHHPSMPRPLLSEALRGEGAVLRDEHGAPFMTDEHPLGDLAPRDVVARAITRRLVSRGLDHLWLDATTIDDFATRFPTIWRSAEGVGLDPTRDWLPVAPAAHYLCGGVSTDLDGATTLSGLWACGEAACSGVHGANRLASNSLLDGLVFAPRVVNAIVDGKDGSDPTGVLRSGSVKSALPSSGPRRSRAMPLDELQRVMTAGAGVLRDRSSLEQVLDVLPIGDPAVELLPADPAGYELRNLVTVGWALASAALAREESRGTHTRLDYPERSSAFLGRFFAAGNGPTFLPLPADVREPSA